MFEHLRRLFIRYWQNSDYNITGGCFRKILKFLWTFSALIKIICDFKIIFKYNTIKY